MSKKDYDIFLDILKQNKIDYHQDDDSNTVFIKRPKNNEKIIELKIPDYLKRISIPNLFIGHTEEELIDHKEYMNEIINIEINISQTKSILEQIEFNKIKTYLDDVGIYFKTTGRNEVLEDVIFNDLVEIENISFNGSFALKNLKIKNKFIVSSLNLEKTLISQLENLDYVENLYLSGSEIKTVKNMYLLKKLNANNSLIKSIEDCPNLSVVNVKHTPIKSFKNCSLITSLDISETTNIKVIDMPCLKEIKSYNSSLRNIQIKSLLSKIELHNTSMSNDFYSQIENLSLEDRKILFSDDNIKNNELWGISKKNIGLKVLFQSELVDIKKLLSKGNDGKISDFYLSTINDFMKSRKATLVMEKLFLQDFLSITKEDLKKINKKDKYKKGILYYAHNEKCIKFLYENKYDFSNENYDEYHHFPKELKSIIQKYHLLQSVNNNSQPYKNKKNTNVENNIESTLKIYKKTI